MGAARSGGQVRKNLRSRARICAWKNPYIAVQKVVNGP